MWTKKRVVALLVVAAVMAVLVWWADSTSDPKYQGKPLSFWLAELKSGDGARREAARIAIRKMGTKAVPPLIGRLRYHTPFWRRQLEWLSSRQRFYHISVIDEDAYADLAHDGFWALGTNGVAGLPELTRMLNDPRYCVRAGRVLPYLGAAAIPALTNSFVNPDPHVRAAAVLWLGVNQSCFSNLWSNVLPLLKDGSVEVRCSAVQGIGGLEVHPEIVVPAMTNLLGETNANVLSATCWGITSFRTNAVMAVPLLVPLCQHSNSSVRYYARQALRVISPEAADKAGIH